MHRTIALFTIVCASATASCGEKADSTSSRADGTHARADTTVVTSQGDGIWGPAHDVVEVLRVTTNTKETTFGQVRGLEAAPDGGVFVYDAKGPDGGIIRRFDANGKFVRNIGRDGHGPGEYSGEIVRVHESNGVIAIRDEQTINRFTANGKFINGFSVGRSAGFYDVAQGADGSIYTTAPRTRSVPRRGEPPPAQTVFHYNSTGGLLDSIAGTPWLVTRAPTPNVLSPVQLHETRFALSDGRVIVGRSDRLGFLVIAPNGTGAPLIAEYQTPPVPYLADERAQLRAAQRRAVNVDGERMANPDLDADVPQFKPPLISIRPDGDGRIWIMTPGPSTKLAEPRCNSFVDNRCVGKTSYTQSSRLLGFRADGAFLGEIRFSKQTSLRAFAGDYAWSLGLDDDDVPFLVKYRLHD
jgi:hypothetical protein